MSGDVLADAASAEAVPRAVVAVPVFVFQDFVQVVLIIGPEAKSAKFAIALIIDVLWLFAIFRSVIWVKV